MKDIIKQIREAKQGMDEGSIASEDLLRDLLMEHCSQLLDLARWKEEYLTVESWWKEIDTFVRNHPDTLLGDSVSHAALKMLKERDEFKRVAKQLHDRLAEHDGCSRYGTRDAVVDQKYHKTIS